MAKQIKRGNPGNRIVAVLWHQGESDVYANATKEYYREKLQILIDGFRTELCDSDLPFIAGNMVEEWRNSQPCAANIISATEDVIKNNRNCAFVSSDGLSGNPDGDFIHFSNKANIVFGQRYFKAYESLL